MQIEKRDLSESSEFHEKRLWEIYRAQWAYIGTYHFSALWKIIVVMCSLKNSELSI